MCVQLIRGSSVTLNCLTVVYFQTLKESTELNLFTFLSHFPDFPDPDVTSVSSLVPFTPRTKPGVGDPPRRPP